jgi:hypothetical protein
MTDKLAVIDVECEVVEETTAALAPAKAYVRAEPLRVIERIPVDYFWNEEKQGFYPVYGSLYGDGDRPFSAKPSAGDLAARLATPQPRKLPK